MADSPKTRSVKLANNGAGARTFFNDQGEPQMLARGATYDGKILDADYESLKDLEDSGDGATAGGSAIDKAVDDYPDVAGVTDRNQLLQIAEDEGLRTMADDASVDDIRKAIEHSREANAPLLKEMRSLKGKSRAELIKAADKDDIRVETDDNADQLRRKVAEGRVAKS